MGASHDLAPAWNRHCSKPTGCGLQLLLSMDGTDRRTDSTPSRYIDPALRVMRTASVMKKVMQLQNV